MGDYGRAKPVSGKEAASSEVRNRGPKKPSVAGNAGKARSTQKAARPLAETKHVKKKTGDLKKDVEVFKKIMNDIEGTLTAKLLDNKMKSIEEMTVRELLENLREKEKVNAVVFDGIVTQRLVDIASEKNIHYLVGMKYGKIKKKPEFLEVISINSKGVSYAEV